MTHSDLDRIYTIMNYTCEIPLVLLSCYLYLIFIVIKKRNKDRLHPNATSTTVIDIPSVKTRTKHVLETTLRSTHLGNYISRPV